MIYSHDLVNQHFLLDTGAPRTICGKSWLSKASWIILKNINLPPHIQPFRFTGNPVFELYGVLLATSLTDNHGKSHVLKIFTNVFPPAPVPFLLDLTDSRRFGFDICLREQHASHLHVSSWNAVFPFIVTFHIWVPFTPITTCSAEFSDASHILSTSKFAVPSDSTHNTHIGIAHTSSSIVTQLLEVQRSRYLIPPWRRETWDPSTTCMELYPIHQALNNLRGPHYQKSFSKILEISRFQRSCKKNSSHSAVLSVLKHRSYLANPNSRYHPMLLLFLLYHLMFCLKRSTTKSTTYSV